MFSGDFIITWLFETDTYGGVTGDLGVARVNFVPVLDYSSLSLVFTLELQDPLTGDYVFWTWDLTRGELEAGISLTVDPYISADSGQSFVFSSYDEVSFPPFDFTPN